MKWLKEAVADGLFAVFGMLVFGWDSLTALLILGMLHCAAYIWQAYTPLPPHRPNPDRRPDANSSPATTEGTCDSSH